MESKETCKWKDITKYLDIWTFKTSCGAEIVAATGLEYYRFKFCPYCAKEIEEVKQ